ncbi:Gliding motility lipoprotein GldH [Flavobacterium longum]|uniref:hypothetical protein n=1 Tax=Flavobacterium longum TaxID=1299340 RepID=UPI0039EB132A
MKRTLLLLAACALLASCTETVYKEYETDLVGNRWQKNDVKTFNFTLEESGVYDIAVDFSHVYGTQFPSVPLKVVLVKPDQSRETVDYLMQLRDGEGNELGDCTGDYCDLREPVFTKKELKAGNYQISVAHVFDYEFVPNVLGIGVRVTESED